MTYEQAIKIALGSIKKEMHQYAVDANLHRHFGNDNLSAIKADEKYTLLEQASKVLKGQRKLL